MKNIAYFCGGINTAIFVEIISWSRYYIGKKVIHDDFEVIWEKFFGEEWNVRDETNEMIKELRDMI